jgi:hypothetical protein
MNEQSLLKLSIGLTVMMAAFGVIIGFTSGSAAIMFDGVYALTDAFMTVIALLVARLITASAAPLPARCSSVDNPDLPHSCTRYRSPVMPSLGNGKTLFVTRTRDGWMPVTSTRHEESLLGLLV